MTSERRQMPRYPCHLRTSLMIDGQMFEAVCSDIGPGGAYLATAIMAAPGTRVGVVLATPQATSMVAAAAEVMYTVHRSATRQTGVAVRWLEMTPQLNRVITLMEDGFHRANATQLGAAQAVTSPMPAARPSDAAADRTARYEAAPQQRVDLPITQPTRKKT